MLFTFLFLQYFVLIKINIGQQLVDHANFSIMCCFAVNLSCVSSIHAVIDSKSEKNFEVVNCGIRELEEGKECTFSVQLSFTSSFSKRGKKNPRSPFFYGEEKTPNVASLPRLAIQVWRQMIADIWATRIAGENIVLRPCYLESCRILVYTISWNLNFKLVVVERKFWLQRTQNLGKQRSKPGVASGFRVISFIHLPVSLAENATRHTNRHCLVVGARCF